MVSQSIKNEILEIIFFNTAKEQCSIFLFGSFAKGEENRTSDIDIGILPNEPIDYALIYKIKEDVNEKVNTLRMIDIVDFSRATDGLFIKEATKEAVLWYQGKECKVPFENWRMQLQD